MTAGTIDSAFEGRKSSFCSLTVYSKSKAAKMPLGDFGKPTIAIKVVFKYYNLIHF
jgi:hypothetical protein